MKQSDITKLSKLYKNWLFVLDGPKSLRVSSSVGNKSEVSQLITTLLKTFEQERLSLSVQEKKELIIELRNNRRPKYQRMYTSGCFDIFHYGHLNILQKSKALCDHLIVGVSTDELIAKEKGSKPIIPYKERAKVIEAISYVDEVIPQIDKNKQRIVDEYQIDAISVGDDWKGRYPRVSCAMEYFPYTKNVSSTVLKDTLKIAGR